MSTLVNTSSTEISVEISVVKQKYDELLKKSLLNRSQFEGQLKEKTKVISDLKVKEGKDIDTMIEMDKQIKFLNEILYKRNQSIQTIHMLAPKCATYHGRSTFANPKYCKKAQSDKPRLYEIPYDTSDPANRFCPDGEDTVTLENESRSKLDKDKVKPYNYTYQNSLYETFKPPSKAYLDQLERAKEVRKTMWRKTFKCKNNEVHSQDMQLNSETNRDDEKCNKKVYELMEQMATLCDLVGQAIQKKEEEERIAEDQAAKDRYWKIPICYDDDEDNTTAITPIVVNSNDDNSSSDDDSSYGEDIDYIDASSPNVEIVSLEVVEIFDPEVGRIDDDILLTIKDDNPS
ncbi:hypothetical protein Tco_1227601 [Tanacetum coccineum]